MLSKPLSRHNLALLVVAAFPLIWSVIRATIQSVTIDEAYTYRYFAAKSLSTVWTGDSNNHVLNTLLIWISTRLFGTSAITLQQYVTGT